MAFARNWLVEQLPRPMAEDRFIRQFVALTEEISTAVRQEIEDVPAFLDVSLAPEQFVRWLGSWLGLAAEPVDEDPQARDWRLRLLVREVGSLFVRRGTRSGLEGMLTALTGQAAYVEDSGGIFAAGAATPNRKHAIVHLQGAGGVDEQALLRLVRQEVAIDTTFEFRIGDRRIVEDATTSVLEEVGDDGEAMPQWAMDEIPDVPLDTGVTVLAGAPEAPSPGGAA
jgi:phage tail-like protein